MPLVPTVSLGPLVAFGHRALRMLGLERAPASGQNDPQAAEAMRRAEAARAGGHADEARTMFRYVVQRWPAHVGALHTLRDLAVEARAWDEAIGIQESILALAPSRERHAEAGRSVFHRRQASQRSCQRGAAAPHAVHRCGQSKPCASRSARRYSSNASRVSPRRSKMAPRNACTVGRSGARTSIFSN